MCHHLGRRIHKPRGQFPGPAVKEHVAEAIPGAHFFQCALYTIGQGCVLSLDGWLPNPATP